MNSEEDFNSLSENVVILSFPFYEKNKMMIHYRAMECERREEKKFSERYKILLFQYDLNNRMKLTDEFEANFMDGKPFRYVENLSKSGIFAAVLNMNLKNLEENIQIAKKVFEFC
jgi:hypothetical protein